MDTPLDAGISPSILYTGYLLKFALYKAVCLLLRFCDFTRVSCVSRASRCFRGLCQTVCIVLSSVSVRTCFANARNFLWHACLAEISQRSLVGSKVLLTRYLSKFQFVAIEFFRLLKRRFNLVRSDFRYYMIKKSNYNLYEYTFIWSEYLLIYYFQTCFETFRTIFFGFVSKYIDQYSHVFRMSMIISLYLKIFTHDV